MASLAQVFALVNVAITPSRRIYQQCASVVTDVQAFLDTQHATAPQSAALEEALQTDRDELENFVSVERLKAKLDPLVKMMGEADEVVSIKTDPNEILDDVNAYLNTSGKRVKTRSFVRGGASSGIGNGFFRRVTQNRYGLDTDASYPDTLTFTVDGDQSTGAQERGREIVRLEGFIFRGQIERGVANRGSGIETKKTAVNGADALAGIDPNFSSVTGTDAAPGALSSWTMAPNVGDGSDWIVDRTNYFMKDSSDNANPGCIFYKSSSVGNPTTIQKAIADIGPVVAGTPYYAGVRVAVADGAAAAWIGKTKVYWGSKSVVYPLCGAVCTATPGGAGNVDVGDHWIAITYTLGGVEGPICAAVKVTVAGIARTIALTAIPDGPAGSAKNIYVSKVADSGAIGDFSLGGKPSQFWLLTTIADGVTIATYNTADAGLAATHPWQVCAAENRTNPCRHVLLDCLGPGTNQSDLYPENWTTDLAQVGVSIEKKAGVGIYLSKFLFLPMQAFDDNAPRPGQFGLLIGGATPWIKGNSWTVADTCGTGIVNEDLFLCYGQTLLGTTGGGITYADPVIA